MSINMRSFGKRFYFSLSTFPLSLFVKAHLIPSNNLQNLYHELGIDPDKPIAYILPFNSIFDLMILRRYCLKLGLPDPLNPLLINQKSFSRYVFINQTHKLLSKKDSLLKSSLVTFSSLFKKHKEDPELDLQIVPCSILWGRSPGRERENGKATSYLS